METLIQITGLQYDCTEADIAVVMTEMEQQKPEMLLVTEQTQDFGIIVRALRGTTYRGVVSRFDLERVLAMMRHDSSSVLVTQVTETDQEGRCYTVRVRGNYPTPDSTSADAPDIWADWKWTGAPMLNSSDDDRRLDVSLKVAMTELTHNGSISKQTLLEHLNRILLLARWDVSRETQEQLEQTRRLVSSHADQDVRALAPQFRHTLSALGSKKRTVEFQEIHFPELCRSTEAAQMHRQWCSLHKAQLTSIKLWQQTIMQQLETIEACLLKLPADLCYQKDLFGELMHRLIYLNIPRRKLQMLQSALVLQQCLRRQLGLSDDDSASLLDKRERDLALQLAPIFYGNTDDAREFLLLARGQKPSDITTLVTLWVRDKRICAANCHRPLWTILHEAGIYTATESNWNMHLDIRKAWR